MTWFKLQVAGRTIYIQAVHAEQALLRLWHGWELRHLSIPENAKVIIQEYNGTPAGPLVFARPEDVNFVSKSDHYETRHPKIFTDHS